MRILADATIEAILYISMASGDDDREDDDVRALESLVVILRGCTPDEREELREAIGRARSAALAHGQNSAELLANLEALESDIFGEEPA